MNPHFIFFAIKIHGKNKFTIVKFTRKQEKTLHRTATKHVHLIKKRGIYITYLHHWKKTKKGKIPLQTRVVIPKRYISRAHKEIGGKIPEDKDLDYSKPIYLHTCKRIVSEVEGEEEEPCNYSFYSNERDHSDDKCPRCGLSLTVLDTVKLGDEDVNRLKALHGIPKDVVPEKGIINQLGDFNIMNLENILSKEEYAQVKGIAPSVGELPKQSSIPVITTPYVPPQSSVTVIPTVVSRAPTSEIYVMNYKDIFNEPLSPYNRNKWARDVVGRTISNLQGAVSPSPTQTASSVPSYQPSAYAQPSQPRASYLQQPAYDPSARPVQAASGWEQRIFGRGFGVAPPQVQQVVPTPGGAKILEFDKWLNDLIADVRRQSVKDFAPKLQKVPIRDVGKYRFLSQHLQRELDKEYKKKREDVFYESLDDAKAEFKKETGTNPRREEEIHLRKIVSQRLGDPNIPTYVHEYIVNIARPTRLSYKKLQKVTRSKSALAGEHVEKGRLRSIAFHVPRPHIPRLHMPHIPRPHLPRIGTKPYAKKLSEVRAAERQKEARREQMGGKPRISWRKRRAISSVSTLQESRRKAEERETERKQEQEKSLRKEAAAKFAGIVNGAKRSGGRLSRSLKRKHHKSRR